MDKDVYHLHYCLSSCCSYWWYLTRLYRYKKTSRITIIFLHVLKDKTEWQRRIISIWLMNVGDLQFIWITLPIINSLLYAIVCFSRSLLINRYFPFFLLLFFTYKATCMSVSNLFFTQVSIDTLWPVVSSAKIHVWRKERGKKKRMIKFRIQRSSILNHKCPRLFLYDMVQRSTKHYRYLSSSIYKDR